MTEEPLGSMTEETMGQWSEESFPFLHLLDAEGELLPAAFTFPFRYTPHPLCRKAALLVQKKLGELGAREGKMYGVLVGRDETGKLYFLAAYSGQLFGRYDHPWFVPPVVDYLNPDSYFQREQAEIVGLNHQLEALRESSQKKEWNQRLQFLKVERETAVESAKRIYQQGKEHRLKVRREGSADETLIRESQQQKADIHRARQLHKQEISELEQMLKVHEAAVRELAEQRKRRSEALQQWLFRQFVFLNARGERKNLTEIFDQRFIPSGAGECCAPKLLQAAYQLGLKPLAMGEFWWGTSTPGTLRRSGVFYPSCRSKCYPILGHMLQGLEVEPDPAQHYEERELEPLRVLWEDEYLAVVDKPDGWCSIPGRSDQPNLLDEAYRLWPDISGSIIVHRLDQDTSGLMVLAKSAAVHRALSQQFERREVHKRYIALVEGWLEQTSGVIELPLAPEPDELPRQRVDRKRGKEALTTYEVLGQERRLVASSFDVSGQPMEKTLQGVTRVAFFPSTGRTHQLRVHASSPEGLGTPILGDRLYGHLSDRLYLHAESIQFVHPLTKEEMHFESKAPF